MYVQKAGKTADVAGIYCGRHHAAFYRGKIIFINGGVRSGFGFLFQSINRTDAVFPYHLCDNRSRGSADDYARTVGGD